VLWPRIFFPALRALEGDKRARDLLASNSESILRIQLETHGVLRDPDTPEDLAENGLWMHAPR
jgi:molybdenum cofactor cytidylyltransferase